MNNLRQIYQHIIYLIRNYYYNISFLQLRRNYIYIIYLIDTT